jgi:pimeloyl-ACP methyl ester carboxylesterase
MMDASLLNPYFLAAHEGRRPPAPRWFEDAVEARPVTSWFETAGASIELLTWGEVGKPGLLFVHGNRAHADWWSFIAPFFARDWRCAALSLSGMGGSSIRPEQSTLDDFMMEVLDAVTAAELNASDTPPILIGHSMGGSVGLRATSGNDLFHGLILVDTPVNIDPNRTREMAAQAPQSRSAHRPFTDLTAGLARFRLSPPQAVENEFIGDFLARRSLVERDGAWVWKFDPRGIKMGKITNESPLGGIRCPIALIYGEDSAFFRTGEAEAARTLLPPGSPVLGIPATAHHVMLDQPMALVATLRALLSRWPTP